MGTRVLIVLVVIIVLLAVLAVVLGANRKDAKSENDDVKAGKTGMAPFLAQAFGWMSPKFDLADLQVQNASIDREKRTLMLNAGQQFTVTVVAHPDADINSCRSLKLVLVEPKATMGGASALELKDITLNQPLPDPDKFEPPKTGQLLPNNRLEPDPISKKIDPKRIGECAIPVFRGGATLVFEAKRTCTVAIR